MGRHACILAGIFGVEGWKVKEAYFEWSDGTRAEHAPPVGWRINARLVLSVERRWTARCSDCGARCGKQHAKTKTRRWHDMPWAGHPVEIEATPIRVKCARCDGCPVELIPWAGPYERETRRLQNHLALQCASMPTMHVAVQHGLSWGTVRRAEAGALKRWAETRTESPLRHLGIDEKYLGRRHKREEKWVTIISNNETGEPLWIGFGRAKATVKQWLATLSKEQKKALVLAVMDMHEPFKLAIYEDEDLAHVKVIHDQFHIIKRANEAVNEVRKDTFFRAGAYMRGLGRGTKWLVLRSWENSTEEQRDLRQIACTFNRQLQRACEIRDELRVVLRAPDKKSMEAGLRHVLRRTQRRSNKHLRKLHESLLEHWDEIVALGEHHPATGRVEALNNNWECLVRRSRGCRDLHYMLLKLKFMTANPIRKEDDVKRFLALGLLPPMRRKRATA
jgi:transposase